MEEGNIDFNYHYKQISNELKSAIREEVLNDESSVIHKALVIFTSGEGDLQDVKAVSNCRDESTTLFSLIENGLLSDETISKIMELAQKSIDDGIGEMVEQIEKGR